MKWKEINTQQDLDELNASVCWDDSETIEYYATLVNADFFPSEVSRSGYDKKNVHILCRVDSKCGPYLEMVWIHADSFNSYFLDSPHLRGKVDSLKRIEIECPHDGTEMRCGRLIYRFLNEAEVEREYHIVKKLRNKALD